MRNETNNDPFQFIREDHTHIAEILDQMESTTESTPSARTQLLSELRKALSAHTTLEQDIFYPCFKERAPLRDMGIEAENEDELIANLVEELRGIDPSTEDWFTWFAVVKESIEHHSSVEEVEMFQKMREEFSPEELAQLGEQVRVFKEEFKAA